MSIDNCGIRMLLCFSNDLALCLDLWYSSSVQPSTSCLLMVSFAIGWTGVTGKSEECVVFKQPKVQIWEGCKCHMGEREKKLLVSCRSFAHGELFLGDSGRFKSVRAVVFQCQMDSSDEFGIILVLVPRIGLLSFKISLTLPERLTLEL